MKLTIAWLYPDLMSVYGDRGNIIALTRRCEWRGIDVVVKRILLDTPMEELQSCDLLFMGGAQDRQQKIVAEDLQKKSGVISDMTESGVPGLYICGAFQFLGKYYKKADGSLIEGLGIFDLHTINPGSDTRRLIGEVATEINPELPIRYSWSSEKTTGLLRHSLRSRSRNDNVHDDNIYLVGFENHGGRTYLGKSVRPLGKIVKGFGNNGVDGTEGAVYKNSIGTYLHGPILPKNPHLADHIIRRALEVKYKKKVELAPLDDLPEKQAHAFIAKRLGIEI